MTIKSMVRWTAEENAQMAEMVAQKMPRKLIARALNRSIGSIRSRIDKGIPQSKRPPLTPSAKAERQAIVAWLRAQQGPSSYTHGYADAIEAGEHLS